MSQRVFLVGGMRPDTRVFQNLQSLLPNAVLVPWIKPEAYESFPHYAARLAETIPASSEDILCGVSFGGMIAREAAPRLGVRKCVLISSVRSHRELPPGLRALRPFAGPWFESILKVLGGRRGSRRLQRFAGPDGDWYRWAASAVLRWQTSSDVDVVPSYHIHGDRDETFPLRYVRPDVILSGGHTVIVTQAAAIARLLQSTTE